MAEGSQNTRDETRWPLSQMLARGTFGTGTRAERRLSTRSTVIFIVVIGWLLLSPLAHLDATRVRLVTVFLVSPALTFYAWEKRKYFLSLDELTQRIELEGMAWAYVIGVLASLWAGSIGYAVSVWWPQIAAISWWRLPFIFAMSLAIVKAAYRYFATRRY